MYKAFAILLTLITLLIGNTFAQQINITGKVINKVTNVPVEGADIVICSDGTVIYQTTSDSTGSFKIPFDLFKKAGKIKIHAMNYSDFQADESPSVDNTLKTDLYLHTYKISPEVIRLKEVKINSKKRYSDTTKIDLSNEKPERSVMIDDIFSQRYGFTRDANGLLYYKGRIVSDVTVNGGDFFGKNNLDIFHLLPAMVLNKINIIETNIDSLTNTTLLRPAIKIDLILKEKYNAGKFGNANVGAGTSQRYIANTDLHAYNNKQQVSLSLNSNNINSDDNTIYEPKVNFSANGNNSTANSGKLSYRNVFADKVEVNFSARGKFDKKDFISETAIQEKNVNLFSKTFNSSSTNSFELNDARLNINYRVDPLTNITVLHSYSHSNTRDIDSINYNIRFDSLTTAYQLNKKRNTNTDWVKTKVTYQKKFNAKKGRLLSADVELSNNYFKVGEVDNIRNTANLNSTSYFIDGHRTARENSYTISIDLTEPIDDNSYINAFLITKKDKLNYDLRVNSDTTLNNPDSPSLLINNYIEPGVKFQKSLNKVSINANVTGIFNLRRLPLLPNSNKTNANVDFDLRIDYKINKKDNFSLNCSGATTYPDINQLTSLNSSFDLIEQTNGNILLKPEEKRSIKVVYSARPSDSENLSLSGSFDHYSNKFGFNIIRPRNSIAENILIDNTGSANSGQISFSFFKIIAADRSLNYTGNVSYQESPTAVNYKKVSNNGITFNQSFSTSIGVIKSLLTVTPLFAASYSRYFYNTNTLNITTLTYSDKISVNAKLFQLNLYPLFNYNQSIGSNNSFSVNGEVKKSIFKKYGILWLQAYDIFNSFKYYNDFIGPSDYRSVKYSNLQRYVLLGLTLRFNDIK